jgi:hypothetical protein
MDSLLSRLEDPSQQHAMPSAVTVKVHSAGEDTMQAPRALPVKHGVKRKKKVLEEEEYVDTLSHIIERDYFPQLAASRVSPEETAATSSDLSVTSFFEQFTSYDNDSFEDLQRQSQAEHRKKFHWLYELPAIEGDPTAGADTQRRPGMLMLYYLGNNVLSAQQRERMDAILDGAAEERVGDGRRNGVAMGKFRVRNQLMFPPELAASEDTCDMHAPRTGLRAILPAPENAGQKLLTDGPAATAAFNNRSNNLEALHRAVARYNSRVNTAPDARHEKIIQKRNTDFPAPSPGTEDAGPSLTAAMMRSWQAAFRDQLGQGADARTRWQGGLALEAPHTPSLRSSDAESSKSETSSVSGHGHRRDRAYLPVPMSPCPVPGEGALGSLTPLFTWGDVEDSPLLLGRQVTDASSVRPPAAVSEDERRRWQAQALREEEESAPRFSMRPASQRELLARRLDTTSTAARAGTQRSEGRTPLQGRRDADPDDGSVASIKRYYREGTRGHDESSSTTRHGSVSSSKSTAQRLASLTPAARALALKLNKGLQSGVL